MMKPRIGLNCDIEETNRTRSRIWSAYHELVIQFGGVPLIIPPDVHPSEVAELLDGVVLIGGDDYRCGLEDASTPPERFLPVHPAREDADIEWARFLLDSELPCLGICGGFQVLAVVAGGRLYGDIVQQTGSKLGHSLEAARGDFLTHDVTWTGDLDAGPEAGRFTINSSHHQAISKLPPDWRGLATADDGIIEAACDPTGRVVGVQWHPELISEEPLSSAITQRFIEWSRRQMSGSS